MFTLSAIWSAHAPEVIENPETGKPGNFLLISMALDLITAIALIVVGSLAASNIISVLPGGSYAMIGIGCFQIAPFFLGGFISIFKDNNLAPALSVLGVINNSEFFVSL